MSAQEVATREAAELAIREGSEAIEAAQEQEFDDELLQVPILKIGQGLTREVQDGNAEVGEFINTLTNTGLGDTVDFVVSYYHKGRFASDKDGRAFVAFDSTIPQTWEALVGKEFVGTPFAEYSEAEEQFKASVNNGSREWGNGPLVSTTHNYTGLLLPADDDEEALPARLSLKRIDVPAARKINTLKRAVLRKRPFYDKVLRLTTFKREFGRNAAYVINPADVRFVRDTTADERTAAFQIAQAVVAGRVHVENPEDALDEKPAEPKEGEALSV